MTVSKSAASESVPEPRAIARSMLSFGIEYERAFSIAFWSARFPAGSPPPSLAATMIARDSFEKSFPRLASAAPFLCLIDDHLLCPDNVCLPHELQELLVHPRVVRQLRVERRDEDPPVAREHRAPIVLGEHLDSRADLLDPRRADEHGLERLPLELELRLEACDLPPVGVAPNADVGEPEVVTPDEDHPGARAEDRPLEA